MGEKALWKLVGAGAGVAAGMASRFVLNAAWQRTKGGDPPTNPAERSTSWPDALIWAVASGVVIGVARMVAERGAASAWHAATGANPPGVEAA